MSELPIQIPTSTKAFSIEPPAEWMQEMFMRDIAAEVAPVVLTHEHRRRICYIVGTLANLVDASCPNNLRTALIQGAAIERIAGMAWGLKYGQIGDAIMQTFEESKLKCLP